jgi:molybdopterin molybdotransferase
MTHEAQPPRAPDTYSRVDQLGFPLHRARSRAVGAIRPAQAVAVSPAEAVGSVLASDATALVDLPPFDVADDDGWAVAGPGPWRVAADQPPHAPLPDAMATRIEVGGALPPNSTGVLPEWAGQSDPSHLAARGAHPGHVEFGAHTRLRGADAAAGTVLAVAGDRVSPICAGLAAAAGNDILWVFPAPSVALLLITDDVLEQGLPTRGRMRDSVGPMVPGWIAQAGGRAFPTSRTPGVDLAADVADSAADIVIVTGGTGTRSTLVRAATELAAEPIVSGVAVDPGGSMAMFLLPDGRPLIGVPGDPLGGIASLVSLVLPVLEAMGGAIAPRGHLGRLVHTQRAGDRARLLPVTRSASGLAATVGADSSPLRALTLSDALAVIPAGGAVAGSEVEYLQLP